MLDSHFRYADIASGDDGNLKDILHVDYSNYLIIGHVLDIDRSRSWIWINLDQRILCVAN